MANQFAIEPPNVLQALMTGVQGYDAADKRTKEAAMMAGRQDAAQALQTGGDLRGPLAKLLGIGDTKGAEAIAQFAHQQATEKQAGAALGESSRHNRALEGFQQQEAGRAQTNADRAYTFQVRQADEAAKGFDLREVDDGSGGKMLVRTEKSTGRSERVPIEGQPTEPASPYAPTTKLTGDEAKDRIFVNRMVASHNTINGLENINEGAGGFVGGMMANQPSIRDSSLANATRSPDRQKSIQAQRDFVNAILRKESGAAISQGEFENAQKQYFPQPGDGKDVIDQKKNNRMLAIEGMMQGTGRGYKPPAGYTGTQGPAQPGQAAPTVAMPKVGELRQGYRFKGGDPASEDSWVKAK